MDYLRLSKEWRLEQKNDELQIFGGQDAIFTIEIPNNRRSFFADLGHEAEFKPKKLNLDDQIILEQLLSAGVVTPVIKKNGSAKPKIKIIDKLPKFILDKRLFTQVSGSEFDLLVLIRTNETLAGFIDGCSYLEIDKPHVFLDLAYEHTISLGPLVFPGLTSCVACLKGRIETRWGDQTPPPKTRTANELSQLAKEWLTVELKNFFYSQDYLLVNKTLVMDTQARSIATNKLLTVSLCPYCQKNELLSSGKLEYTLLKS